MTEELKPCPFCGCAPLVQEIEPHKHNLKLGDFVMPDHPGCFTMECPTQNCCGMIADTREELVAAWSRRAAPAVANAAEDIDGMERLTEYNLFFATYRDLSNEEYGQGDENMIRFHADRHWGGWPGKMWLARAAIAATAPNTALVEALKAMLAVQPNANDGRSGVFEKVSDEDVEACRLARAALAAHAGQGAKA